MKKILISRKVLKETNVEFKGVIKCNIFEKFIMYLIGMPREYTLSRAQLVEDIKNGAQYYTKSESGELTEVELVNYKKGYLRSVSNNSSNDNIDSLPIYL